MDGWMDGWMSEQRALIFIRSCLVRCVVLCCTVRTKCKVIGESDVKVKEEE